MFVSIEHCIIDLSKSTDDMNLDNELSMNSLNVNSDFHERHRSLCKHDQSHSIYQILIIVMYKFNLIWIYLSLLNTYRNNLIRYIWIVSMYRGTISPEMSVSIHCILTKSHPRYLSLIITKSYTRYMSLLILNLKNLFQDTWVSQNSPPWRWIYRSSVGEFPTVNVRKQELRKSCSLINILGKSLTYNRCCYACYLF